MLKDKTDYNSSGHPSFEVRDIRFSYRDATYDIPCIDFISVLEVPAIDYESIVKTVQAMYQDYEDINVLSFRRP